MEYDVEFLFENYSRSGVIDWTITDLEFDETDGLDHYANMDVSYTAHVTWTDEPEGYSNDPSFAEPGGIYDVEVSDVKVTKLVVRVDPAEVNLNPSDIIAEDPETGLVQVKPNRDYLAAASKRRVSTDTAGFEAAMLELVNQDRYDDGSDY